jgi:RNA polymerase sigma factor (sigma-70 family)
MDDKIKQTLKFDERFSKPMIDRLHSCLKELEVTQQIAIQLRFWEELTIEQIANELGLSWDEVNRLIDITLDQLRTKIVEHTLEDALVA